MIWPWRRRPRFRELRDPFHAEVLLDGVAVATLSNRVFTEMFWRSYRVESIGSSTAIYDDQLWTHGRFAFHDPDTGQVCIGAFPGGSPPFVRDGWVSLRALYFEMIRRARLPKARVTSRACRRP